MRATWATIGRKYRDEIETKTRVDVIVQDTELFDRPNDVGLLNNADAIHREGRVALDKIDIETPLTKCNGSRQSADAATDNQYICGLHEDMHSQSIDLV
jgi:hypothetical protein